MRGNRNPPGTITGDIVPALLALFQEGGAHSAPELAKRFNVSRDAMYRAIDNLSIDYPLYEELRNDGRLLVYALLQR